MPAPEEEAGRAGVALPLDEDTDDAADQLGVGRGVLSAHDVELAVRLPDGGGVNPSYRTTA
jgi:hypothetical protein